MTKDKFLWMKNQPSHSPNVRLSVHWGCLLNGVDFWVAAQVANNTKYAKAFNNLSMDKKSENG